MARDRLRQQLKAKGISDYRLEKGRQVNLFDLLKSLGVNNPKQTLTRFVHDEIKTSKTIQKAASQANEGTLSLGPWKDDGVLGFVNSTGYPIKLTSQKTRGSGTIQWRRYEGEDATFPLTIKNGGVFEVYVTDIGSSNFGGDRFYVSYKAQRA